MTTSKSPLYDLRNCTGTHDPAKVLEASDSGEMRTGLMAAHHESVDDPELVRAPSAICGNSQIESHGYPTSASRFSSPDFPLSVPPDPVSIIRPHDNLAASIQNPGIFDAHCHIIMGAIVSNTGLPVNDSDFDHVPDNVGANVPVFRNPIHYIDHRPVIKMVISGGGPWNPVETALSGGLAPGMEHIPLPMLDEYTQAAYDLYPDFFVPLINGFDATDSSSAAYISNLLAIPNNPWKGVGEIIVYGHEVYTSDGSSPSFLDIFDVAGQNNLPVLCHWELTPSDVVTLDPNPIQFQQLVSAVTSFPNTRFVIAHCGVGPAISIQVRDAYDLGHYPEIDFFTQQVDDWRNNISNLLALGNVYFDFQGPDNVYSDGSLTLVGEKIQALIEHYPTRFMVGADISANSAHIQLASFAPFGWNTYDSISAFLDHLTPSEQQLVRYENAVTIYENAGASGATVVGPTKVVNFPGYPGQHTLFP